MVWLMPLPPYHLLLH